ncbi:hypothetical protein L3Q82_015477, partial [Scortum barcoo]
MKPVQMVPAISQNWTFHGPGATGQAAANWIAGFGRGPMPPTLLGIRQNLHNQNRRLLGMEEFKAEKQLGRMFYVITLLFLALWSPYIVACYWRVFVKACTIPHRYLSTTVWMSFAQAGSLASCRPTHTTTVKLFVVRQQQRPTKVKVITAGSKIQMSLRHQPPVSPHPEILILHKSSKSTSIPATRDRRSTMQQEVTLTDFLSQANSPAGPQLPLLE